MQWEVIISFLLFLLLQNHIGYNEAQATKVQLNETFNMKTIKSGPIFFSDRRTILVSMFDYLHNGLNNVRKRSKWFKALAADGTTLDDLYFIHFEPAEDVQLMPAELARDYDNENVYLRLGDGVGESERDFARGYYTALVIVNSESVIKSAINLTITHQSPSDLGELPAAIANPLYKNGKYQFTYPKCCPVGTYAGGEGCTTLDQEPMSRVPVYLVDKDGKTYNNVPLTNVEHVPFVKYPECDDMFLLEPTDEQYMLVNGRLISALPNFACMDFIEDEQGLVEVIFMCAQSNHNLQLLNKIYVALMYFSSAMLLLWAVAVTIILLKKWLPPHTSGAIVILTIVYSIFYALHFITLATAREIGVVSDTCKILAYIYQFLLLSSFTAMFGMIFEGFYRVSHYNKEQSKYRMTFYIIFCVVPVITTGMSVVSNEISLSGTSQLHRDSACWFRSDRKVYFYYIPIICIIICCMMTQIMTYFDIRQAKLDKDARRKFENMFRSVAYLNGIMTFCWLLEVLAYCFEAPNNFWFVVDVFNSLQGCVIFGAFSYHYFDEVWRKLFHCSTKDEDINPDILDLEDPMLYSTLTKNDSMFS